MLQQIHSGQSSELASLTERLLAMLRSPDTPIEEIVEQIEQTPGVSEALLDRANSSEFSLQHQIVRVAHAIAVLGLRRAEETVRLNGPHQGPPAPHFRPRQRKGTFSKTDRPSDAATIGSTR